MPASSSRSVYRMLTYCDPPLAMVRQATLRRTAVVERLLQRVEDEARMGRPRDPPADDATGEDVDDESGVDEPLPGRDVGEILSANSDVPAEFER